MKYLNVTQKETVIFIGICFFILTFTNPSLRSRAGLADAQPSVDEQVMLCGNMHIIYLGGGTSAKGAFATTMVMAIRADYTPVGSGTAISVRSDVLADGETDDDVYAVFTDNPKFVEYLQKEVFYEIPFFGKKEIPGEEKSIPVYQANITRSGDGVTRVTERIESEKAQIELTWFDLETPMVLTAPPRGFGPPFKISGVMIPAKSVRVLINGIEAKGELRQGRKEGGFSIPPAFVFFSTAWVKPSTPVPPKE
jgi:hypothetical protein